MFRFNIPVTKVDEEKRLVYGLVTEEIVDGAGEILDYEGSKKYFQEWSDGISKATGGASLGNLRLMHQPVVAGKLIELTFDDALKQIACVAKIVSDDVWKLVLEGCLTGFSMGGKYVKRWKDEANKAITRFIARPVEVSVVDNPCVSTATFEYIKSDGTTEVRKFHPAGDGIGDIVMHFTPEQIAAKALELAKTAGTDDATPYMEEALTLLKGEAEAAAAATGGNDGVEIEEDESQGPAPAADPENPASQPEAEPTPAGPGETTQEAAQGLADPPAADPDPEVQRAAAAETLVQVWLAPDGTTHAKKAEAVDHVLANPAAPPAPEETAVEKALREAREGAAEATTDDAPLGDLPERLESVGKALSAAACISTEDDTVVKCIYGVARLASILNEFQYLVASTLREQKERGQTDSAVAGKLWEALTQMGETLIEMAQEEVAVLMATMGDMWPAETLVVEVVELGELAEMTKANQSLLDRVEKRRGGTTLVTSIELTPEAIEKTDVVKALRAELAMSNEEVTKALEGIASLGETVREQGELIKKFGKSPQPLPPRTDSVVVVERMGKKQTITDEDLASMPDAEKADLAIRLSQMNPQRIG